MQGRKSFQACGSLLCELETDNPVIGVASVALDQTGGLGTVDEPDGAVMAKEQIVGDLADGRSLGVVMTADGEE